MTAGSSLHHQLDIARKDLLDLSARNRLIHSPRGRSRARKIDVVGERSEDVFRILVKDQQAMGFLPRPASAADGGSDEDEEAENWLPQPDEDGSDQSASERYSDHSLQTRLTSDGLQKRLLGIYYDAKTFEEEQGVNILYLALGFLKWFEDDSSDKERFAPLLLVPVSLNRQSANARFRLRCEDAEISTNLSLQAKLHSEFGLTLPDLPEVDELSPEEYFDRVRLAVSTKSRWEVQANEMVLWFFSFAKFLMYRDLEPKNWPGHRPLGEHPLVKSLLGDGFRSEPPICGDDDFIDPIIAPLDMVHVTDADSSQALVIEEVRRGRSLVIQGPPGTGKSQTITNAIASAVKAGKKVLFVAEKMAALDVVKRRLDQVGLGDICLELHSHKANKRVVHQDLERTLRLGRPKLDDVERHAVLLQGARDRLNRHAESLHAPLEPSGLKPFFILGELVRLRTQGVQPADFDMPGAEGWSAAEFRKKINLLDDVVLHLSTVGNPAEHPWRGVTLNACLPTDLDRIRLKLPALIEKLARLISVLEEFSTFMGVAPPDTAVDAAELGLLGQQLAAAPEMDKCSLADSIWVDRRQEISELVACGVRLAACREQLREIIAEAGWSVEVGQARRDLAAHGRSLLRWFNRSYREAQATLQGILRGPAPKSLTERLNILDTLIEYQNGVWDADVHDGKKEIGRRAFGRLWRGAESDWVKLQTINQWEFQCRQAGVPANFRQIVAGMADRSDLAKDLSSLVKELGGLLKPVLEELRGLFQSVQLDLATAFGGSKLHSLSLLELKRRVEQWQADAESISKWIAYRRRADKLAVEGLGCLLEIVKDGGITVEAVTDRFYVGYYERLVREAFRQRPNLAEFDGQSHEQLQHEFRKLDLMRIELSQREVALAHYLGMPRGDFAIGETGVLQREMNKKRSHLPLRQLLKRAGNAVQAIKPVFMMSPISVAQYLEPGGVEFDLLLIDEASQVRPVDALGAVARAKQIVVVGDDKQLPPTQFFNKLLAEDASEDDEEGFHAGDLSSILGLCKAQSAPQRMLRWHYRSRHHSLIALSNREFYDDQLFVVPSPEQTASDGLRFHHIAAGTFDRGQSATNRIEAAAVARAVMEHVRNAPGESLGVGAFSVAQRDAILDELELLRRQDKQSEYFFASGGKEPFFVKNLENIQGDERDVIFISVGYAKDASGFMSMQFGPLSNDGGERRLNVLITRARNRCEVFSSITADDIDLNRTKARGAQALKAFLSYAATGRLGIAQLTERDHDSEFERQVANALRQQGFQVHAQVGVAGFFIDLAVVDSETPGRYLLGIECDGAAYHSSRSSRDRDRLRQAVLEDRGWIIHRIWSTDWFHRPEEQLRKTIATIEAAKIQINLRHSTAFDDGHAAIVSIDEAIERDAEGDTADRRAAVNVVPYVEAQFTVSEPKPIPDVPLLRMMDIVRRVVEIEGPVHREEVVRRIVGLWGGSRVGSRISEAINSALAEATKRDWIAADDEFYRPRDQAETPVRSREAVSSPGLRKAEMLPPAEIRCALLLILKSHLGAASDDLIVEAVRMFGFKSTGGNLREVIGREVEYLLRAGHLSQRDDTLYAC